MKPVLADKFPAKRRNGLFAGFLLGIFVVVFLVLGFATDDVFIPLVIAVPVAIAGAWALMGWPDVRRKDGRPLVEEKVRPYLFFVLTPLFTAILYPVLGRFATQAGLPTGWLAVVSLALALLLGATAAYFLVGFPRFWTHSLDWYRNMPAEKRPFLFFPVFAIVFLVLYIGLGVGSTALFARFQAQTVLLLNVQVLLLLPVALLLSALVAYLLVGFPKPRKAPAEYLPKVTGKRRPHVFFVTTLLLTIPLTILVGWLLTSVAKLAGPTFLPDEVLLPLALLLGASLALGASALAWGTPTHWRTFDDYTPGLSPKARLGAAGAGALASMLAVVIVIGLAGVDLFWGLLAGLLVGAAVALVITGAHRRVAARRGADTLVPDLPDQVKSIVLVTTWLVLALLLFSVATYALPGLVALNAVAGLLVGLLVATLLVEQGLIRDLLAERRAERAKRKEWEKRRKEALSGAEDGPKTH